MSQRQHVDQASETFTTDQGATDRTESGRLFVAVVPPPAACSHLAAFIAGLTVTQSNVEGRSTRVSPPERWHLTLAFLGEVKLRRVPRIEAALRRSVVCAPGGAQAEETAEAPAGATAEATAGVTAEATAGVTAEATAGVTAEATAGVTAEATAGVTAEATAAGSPVVTGDPIEVRIAGGGAFGRGRFAIMWAGIGGDTVALTRLAEAVRRELRRARVYFDPKPLRPHLTLARPGAVLSQAEIDADLAILAGYRGPPWLVDELHLVASELGPMPKYRDLALVRLPGR